METWCTFKTYQTQYPKEKIISIDLCLVYHKEIMQKLQPHSCILNQDRKTMKYDVTHLYKHCFGDIPAGIRSILHKTKGDTSPSYVVRIYVDLTDDSMSLRTISILYIVAFFLKQIDTKEEEKKSNDDGSVNIIYPIIKVEAIPYKLHDVANSSCSSLPSLSSDNVTTMEKKVNDPSNPITLYHIVLTIRRALDDMNKIKDINIEPGSVYPYIIMSSIIYPFKKEDNKPQEEIQTEYQVKTYLQNNNAIVRFVNDNDNIEEADIINLIPDFFVIGKDIQEKNQQTSHNNPNFYNSKAEDNSDDEENGNASERTFNSMSKEELRKLVDTCSDVKERSDFWNDKPFQLLYNKFKQMEKSYLKKVLGQK